MAGAREETEAGQLTVAHLVGQFPVLYEYSLREEIAAVARAGIHCRVIAFSPTEMPLPEPFGTAIGVRYLAPENCADWLRDALALPREFLSHALRGEALAQRPRVHWSIRLRRALKGERPDILHAQFGHLGLMARAVARELNIPLVVSFRGQDVLLSRGRIAELRALAGDAALFLARSETMRAELIELGLPPERIVVLPSGIDVGAIPYRERGAREHGQPVRIISAGRLVPKKGFDDALRALAECPAAELEIYGDGPERGPLEALIVELGLTGRARLMGAVSHDALIERMEEADLFLLACRTGPDGEREGIPNVLKEAQAAGLPVISTRHAGVPECVEDGGSGLLCGEGDVACLARNLRELCSQPERWGAMGRRGLQLMEQRFDLKSLALELARRYYRVAR